MQRERCDLSARDKRAMKIKKGTKSLCLSSRAGKLHAEYNSLKREATRRILARGVTFRDRSSNENLEHFPQWTENAEAKHERPLFIFTNSRIEKLHAEYNFLKRDATRRILARKTMTPQNSLMKISRISHDG